MRAPSPTPPLRVWVSDLAGVDPGTLDAAIDDARQVLADAAIETEWIVCTRPGQSEMPAACSAPIGPWILRVRVLSEESARQYPVYETNFGMAFPGEGDRLGSAADVFAARCLRFADEEGVEPELVLGRVLAHEIGHLLLGRNSHSVSGIMTANWKRKQFERAAQGGFAFVGKQAGSMRRQATRRIALRPRTQAITKTAAAQSALGPRGD